MSHSKKWKKKRKLMREHNFPIQQPMSLHHRKCRSNGGLTNAKNTVMLPIKMHQAFHTLFGNNEAEKIAEILNDYFIDPAFEFVCIKRE